MDLQYVTELSKEEYDWWEKEIKSFRKRLIKEPQTYVDEIIRKRNITPELLKSDIESILESSREEVWKLYLVDEAIFHKEILSYLTKTRELPKSILQAVLDKDIFNLDFEKLTKEELILKISDVVGDYAGRVMPYIYQLSLSTTNSRRSRAGKVFEKLIEKFFTIFGYPFDNQSVIGNANYRTAVLSKKVDLLTPSVEKYLEERVNCAVITMKTSLRERWQEVAEELNRTGVPHIYLLTVDNSVTENTVEIIKRYNITLVLYKSEKDTKFSRYPHVKDFETFFLKEIPHVISYWK